MSNIILQYSFQNYSAILIELSLVGVTQFHAIFKGNKIWDIFTLPVGFEVCYVWAAQLRWGIINQVAHASPIALPSHYHNSPTLQTLSLMLPFDAFLLWLLLYYLPVCVCLAGLHFQGNKYILPWSDPSSHWVCRLCNTLKLGL